MWKWIVINYEALMKKWKHFVLEFSSDISLCIFDGQDLLLEVSASFLIGFDGFEERLEVASSESLHETRSIHLIPLVLKYRILHINIDVVDQVFFSVFYLVIMTLNALEKECRSVLHRLGEYLKERRTRNSWNIYH